MYHSKTSTQSTPTLEELQIAVEQIPPGDPAYLTHRWNLSAALASRYVDLGALDDLEAAIKHQEAVVQQAEKDDANMPCYLQGLGVSFGD